MAQAIKSSHIFDYVIYGSNLTAQMIATFLSLENKNVLFIERPLSLGSYFQHPHEQTEDRPYLDPSLSYVPKNEDSEKCLAWLESILGEKIIAQDLQQTPVTFESGDFKPFLGFGDRHFHTMDPINQYVQQDQLALLSTPLQWQEKFKSVYKGQTLLQSQITSIEVEKAELTSIMVNAQKKISTKNLIFCAEPSELSLLLEKEGLTKKNKQILSKATVFSKLVLSFIHKENSLEGLKVQKPLHVLMGIKNDFEPCIGKFQNDSSTWMSYFEDEEIEGFEEVGSLLKSIKRQIKRAYPNFFETVEYEKISIQSEASAYYNFETKNSGQLDKLHNFWVFSPQFYNEFPTTGLIKATMAALEAFELPLEQEIELPDINSVPAAEA
ncbi:MAG: hypothetical protein HOO06_07305 [Bdellovibrionaceae bacterium]|jgi:hypothetical protein|nr:hypothetical protein [Pseudobdellovibrionaceae bacterium]